MRHALYRIRSFVIVAPYTLCLEFNDGTERTINFEADLAGDLYRPLQNLTMFNQVRLDPEVHTIVWPNGADFDPATLHDWPPPEAIGDQEFFVGMHGVEQSAQQVAVEAAGEFEPHKIAEAA